MAFIVHGATGAQGSAVLTALAAAGHQPVAAVRNTTNVDAAAVAVDFSSVDSLTRAYRDADGVFVHLPLGRIEDQLRFAHVIGEAVRRARLGRVVFSTSGQPAETADESNAVGVIVQQLAASGVSYAVVEPRIFLENLLLPVTLTPTRQEGVLRYPIGEGYATSWSSHLDVADVAVRLLIDRTVSGIISVGALPGLLGKDLAAGFGRYLNREVRFVSITPDQFGDLIRPVFGDDAVRPVVASYWARQNQPGDVIREDRSAQTLLGLAPRGIETWLADRGV